MHYYDALPSNNHYTTQSGLIKWKMGENLRIAASRRTGHNTLGSGPAAGEAAGDKRDDFPVARVFVAVQELQQVRAHGGRMSFVGVSAQGVEYV